MVNPHRRAMVWEHVLDVTRLVRYYDRLRTRYERMRVSIRVIILAGATGVGLELINFLPTGHEVIKLVVATIVLLATVLDMARDYSTKRVRVGLLVEEYGQLEGRLTQLWDDIESYSISDDEVRSSLTELEAGMQKLDARSAVMGFTTSKWLNKSCAKQAYYILDDKYGGPTSRREEATARA
ncbi:MAG: hypothetical protein OXJ54_17585 [Gemmatimonadetes bacterium]|nr:hypothetical protein [Candidatus Palauibacter rhopaloidicola]